MDARFGAISGPHYSVGANPIPASQEKVADAAAQATKDIQRADNSVLPVVLFAACLFFAGVTTRMRTIMGQGVILTLDPVRCHGGLVPATVTI